MTQRSYPRWLVGFTVMAILAQGPTLSSASDAPRGGGGFGGGRIGGGFSGGDFGGGRIGGGNFGGGGFGGSQFNAPRHDFSTPSRSFQTPRALPSTPFQSPRTSDFQPNWGSRSTPQLQPSNTLNRDSWSFPTHRGPSNTPGLPRDGGGLISKDRTPGLPSFGQQSPRSTPSRGLLNGDGNPYSSPNRLGNSGGDRLGRDLGTNTPGFKGNRNPSMAGPLGKDGGLDQRATFKPTLGSNNPFGSHPHIGGQRPHVANTDLRTIRDGKAGLHPGGQNLPQFQSRRHGDAGNWGFNGPRHPGGIAGVNGGNWNSSWRHHCVNHHHHNWYFGAWNGYWGFGAYAPFYWSSRYWGLGGFYSPWDYGYSYYNPYCITLVQPVYASLPVEYYSQPVVLPQQPVGEDEDATHSAAYALVDAARNDFRSGNYQAALAKLDQAIPQLPNDTVVHELRGVTLFALGEYRPAAATLNALLAVAPGMDWATLRGMYPDAPTYESQLRRLEDAIRNDPKDPAFRFALAYFYMVTNYPEAAAAQLKKVVELEPQDVVAKKLLESLTLSNEPPVPPAAGTEAATTVPTTDLVGRWRATANGSTFELFLNDALQFEWQVTPANGAAIKQTGHYTATTDRLILESTGQETLVAKVQSLGANRFQMWANDKQALTFERQTDAAVTKPNDIPVVPPPLPLIPAPRPTGEASLPAPLTPVIGADGLPLPSNSVDATKPENRLPSVP